MKTQTTLFQQFLDNYQAKQFEVAIDIAIKLEHTIREMGEDNTIQFFNALGYCYLNLKNYSKAAACFNVLVKEYPTNYLGVDGLIAITTEQGNWEQVLKFATIYQRYYPTMWQGLHYEAIAYKNLGNTKKEKAVYAKMAKKFPEQLLLQLKDLEKNVQLAREQKNWLSVIELCTELQRKFPDMWQGFWWQGDAYRQLKQNNLAKKQFDFLKQKFPHLHYGWEGYIKFAEDNQDWQQAIKLLIEFKQKFPKAWLAYWWKGQNHKRLQEWDLAIAEFIELQKLCPDKHQGFEGEIQIEQARKNWECVAELSVVFQQKFPKMWQGFWWLGEALQNLNRFDEAKPAFALLAEKFPNDYNRLKSKIKVNQ